jgi:hypothetical protein
MILEHLKSMFIKDVTHKAEASQGAKAQRPTGGGLNPNKSIHAEAKFRNLVRVL